VALVGGGDVGCETAEFLAARGREVTILELLPDVAPELVPWTRHMLLDRLVAMGVEILLQSRVTAIDRGRVTYERRGVSNEVAPVDSVVLACGAQPQVALADQLRTAGVEVHTIGDAAQPGNLATAIRAGFQLGASL
jgi:NADPH-dependent 2,4-dienoyl-CoA reductase/sulfur reductase-like enzyme